MNPRLISLCVIFFTVILCIVFYCISRSQKIKISENSVFYIALCLAVILIAAVIVFLCTAGISFHGRYVICNGGIFNNNDITRTSYADSYKLFTDNDGKFIAIEYKENCLFFQHKRITKNDLHNFYLVDLQDKSFITVNSDYAIEENTITEYQVTDYERE